MRVGDKEEIGDRRRGASQRSIADAEMGWTMSWREYIQSEFVFALRCEAAYAMHLAPVSCTG